MEQYKAMIKCIEKQARFWEERKDKIDLPQFLKNPLYMEAIGEKSLLPFVTISREYGAGGYFVGEKLADILNSKNKSRPPWAAYDKNILEKVMDELGLNEKLVNTLTDHARASMTEIFQTAFSSFPPQIAVYKKLIEQILLLVQNGHVIIIGRGGNFLTQKIEKGFHVRLIAPMEWRIEQVSRMQNISIHDAKKMIVEKTKLREGYIKQYIKHDLHDPNNFDLIINSSRFSTEQVARLIIKGMKLKGILGDNG